MPRFGLSLFPDFDAHALIAPCLAVLRTHIIHIDELKMTNRPDVEPAPTDTEIFADPLPEEDLMDTCLNAFGSTEEIYVLPSGPRRGYVKFTEHAAASRAVQAQRNTKLIRINSTPKVVILTASTVDRDTTQT